MHIIESIKDNYLICDCCGDRIAPDEVALEKTDKEGRTIHICIDCENYDKDPETADILEESATNIVFDKNIHESSFLREGSNLRDYLRQFRAKGMSIIDQPFKKAEKKKFMDSQVEDIYANHAEGYVANPDRDLFYLRIIQYLGYFPRLNNEEDQKAVYDASLHLYYGDGELYEKAKDYFENYFWDKSGKRTVCYIGINDSFYTPKGSIKKVFNELFGPSVLKSYLDATKDKDKSFEEQSLFVLYKIMDGSPLGEYNEKNNRVFKVSEHKSLNGAKAKLLKNSNKRDLGVAYAIWDVNNGMLYGYLPNGKEHMNRKMEQYDEDAIKWLGVSKAYNMFSPLFFRESVEDDLARIEAGGFEAFRDEDYDDPGQARAVHQAAQNAGMSDLDYVNHEEVWGKLYDEDPFIADLEENGFDRDSVDLFIDDDLNDIHRPISEQYEELKNDGEVQDRGWNILNILRDGLDTDAYEISDGEYSDMSALMMRLEKYKDDERTPLCAALYRSISAAYEELNTLERKYE